MRFLILLPFLTSCAQLSVVQQQRRDCIIFIHEKGIDEMRNICEYILKGDK